MDPQRLARIPVRMKEFVDSGTIAGAVTLVARHGVVVSLEAVGYQNLETKTRMRADNIFQIRSMTKSITAVGIMILLEEGRLTLSDPVEKHLPEFRDQVLVDQREGEKVVTTKKPSRFITIRDLLTNTSGMPAGDTTVVYRDKTLAEGTTIYAKDLLLEFEPGTRFRFLNAGFTTLGRIIEVASGQPYENFVEQRIVRPLGMKNTFYFPPAEKCDRIASVYDVKDGTLTKVQRDACRKRANFISPSGGWLSTATDMFAFYQMMLNGGTYNGVRILSRASVELMTQIHTDANRTPPSPTANPRNVPPPGLGYGLGWYVRGEAAAPPVTLQSAGTYWHVGYLGTFGWVDPQKDLVGILMIQLESKEGQDAVRDTFIAMTYAAIVE